LFKIHTPLAQIVKTITLWDVLSTSHCSVKPNGQDFFLGLPDLTIVQDPYTPCTNCEDHYLMGCVKYKPLCLFQKFWLAQFSHMHLTRHNGLYPECFIIHKDCKELFLELAMATVCNVIFPRGHCFAYERVLTLLSGFLHFLFL